MEQIYRPKFSFGEIKSKHLIIDIFSQCHSKDEASELFWGLSRPLRVLVIENHALIKWTQKREEIFLDFGLHCINSLLV
jgi:hypothetical protein